jgi:hypothetical protein
MCIESLVKASNSFYEVVLTVGLLIEEEDDEEGKEGKEEEPYTK